MGVTIRQWKGAWWIFVNHRGHRKAKRIGAGRTGHRLAKGIALQLQARLVLGDLSLFAESPPVPTFQVFATQWIETVGELRGIRDTTVENYRSTLTQHLLPAFGALPLSALTVDALERFIAQKRAAGGSIRFADRPLGRGTVLALLAPLKLLLDRAVRAGYLPSNPVGALELRGRRRDPETVDPFTPIDLRQILATARRLAPGWAPLFRLWAQTGLRAGEVTGLQWQDLDLERGTALIRRTWSRGRIGPTKTGRVRSVSLLHPVCEETPHWSATEASRSLMADLRRLPVQSLQPEGFVFGDGRHPLLSSQVNRAWRRILTAARVRYRPPEQLRHTFASVLLSRNAPLLYVQKQGGWQSAEVLLRVYARWLPQAVAEPPSATQAQPERRQRSLSARQLNDHPQTGNLKG